MNHRLVLLSILTLIMGCSSSTKMVTSQPRPLPATIDEAVAGPLRTDSNRPRDIYRHPAETLKFFGVQPNMTVVEVSPGSGWYLEILAPLLVTQGHYIAASSRADEDLTAWIQSHPQVGSKIQTTPFSPPEKVDIAPPGSADMVLTFRNVHNWMASGSERAAFKAFFKALKPGGVLGVVEHRADPKQKRDKKAKSGYVLEKDVIALAQSAGFKLDQKSEINANPKDTKNYPEGVWTLPPTLRLEDKDRAHYLAIGESDRMTLRFVKPIKK